MTLIEERYMTVVANNARYLADIASALDRLAKLKAIEIKAAYPDMTRLVDAATSEAR